MKITRVTPVLFGTRTVLVRVDTDEGITGWGEPSKLGADLLVPAVRSMAALALGQDPLAIEALHERLMVGTYKIEGRMQAMTVAGIEMACWDIKGKAAGLPLYQLLGGAYHGRVRMYGTIKRDTPGGQARRAERCLEAGFTAVKLLVSTRQGYDARPDTTIECVRAVRTAVGPDAEILLDANGAWSVPNAVRMCRALEEYEPYHLEQPVPERDMAALAQVNQATTIPITFGEEDYSLWRYKEAILSGAAEVLQPDPVKAPLLTCKKVGVLAEAFSKAFTPHDTSVLHGMAAALHLVASVPSARGPQECTLPPAQDKEDGADVLSHPFRLERDGCLPVPQAPGLGVDLDERAQRAAIEA
jgi:L-alanine-DL-glutamate epimerase-like enolase superfamily enzyme